jgi:predicted membrane metal-binding protein
MLKPPVVLALLWVYRGGLAGLLLTMIWIRWRRNRPQDGPRPRAAVWTLTLLSTVVAAAGYYFDFGWLSLLYAAGLLALYGLSLPIHLERVYTWVMVIPLLIVAWMLLAIVIDTDGTGNPRVANYEHRLAPELVCRGYPLWYDSLPAVRLVLLREGRYLSDEVVGAIDGEFGMNRSSCVLLPNGEVRLTLTNGKNHSEVEATVKP